MTAARMTDHSWLKYSLFVASMLPAMSRITDDAHYPSQAILGWTLALAATNAVYQAELESGTMFVRPWVAHDIAGISFEVVR